jgi:hypothetical protein
LLSQYKFLRHKTDERSVKELEKTARRKEIVKAKLDKSVQTLRFRESVEPVTVEEGKIGVVLFASFGSVGGDLEDVTTVVEQAVVRGGIDRFMVGPPSKHLRLRHGQARGWSNPKRLETGAIGKFKCRAEWTGTCWVWGSGFRI